jgi:hypothetical protein
VMAAGSSSDVGIGGGGSWGEGAEGGAHLLCWGQDGLEVERGSSRDAAHHKAAVDTGGCTVVFRAVGSRWRGGRFGGVVLGRVGVMQAL